MEGAENQEPHQEEQGHQEGLPQDHQEKEADEAQHAAENGKEHEEEERLDREKSANIEDIEAKQRKLGLSEEELIPNYKEQVKKAIDFAKSWQQRYKLQNDQSQVAMLQEAAQLARALAISCRVYVGSIVFDINQDDIHRFFSPFGTIKLIDMSHEKTTNKHKGYCFIEFEVPEGAAQAIKKRNGAVLGSRPIKVNRPSNYPVNPPPNWLPPPPPERIYVGNVHEGVSEKDLREVFEAFGQVKACVLVPDPLTQKHKGYGYLEYDTVGSADAAAEAMDEFDLGGRALSVCKAFCGTPMPPGIDQMPPPSAAVPLTKAVPAAFAQNVSAVLNTIVKKTNEDSLNKEENIAISGNSRYELMQKLNRDNSGSRTMVLRNMVSRDEVDDELELEVKEECSKFGEVKQVRIHIPEEGDFAKVYVQFVSSSDTAKAIQVFDGRFYGGHKISAQQYDNNRFELGDLD